MAHLQQEALWGPITLLGIGPFSGLQQVGPTDWQKSDVYIVYYITYYVMYTVYIHMFCHFAPSM